MGPSKIKLKVEHKNHQKQAKEQSIQKEKTQKKQEKSGAQLGKNKNKQKQQKKQSIQEVSQLKKSKSKDQKDSKLKDKSSDKKESKDETTNNKKKGKDEKNDQKQGKDKKAKKIKQKQDKKNKKGDEKDKKKSKYQFLEEDQKVLAKSKSKRGLDKQLQTINSINKQTAKAKLTIGQLIEQYKDASYDIFVNKGHNPEKQEQIQLQLQKLQRQKQRRRKKIQQLNRSAQEKRKQKQLEEEEKSKRKKEKILQKRKKNISLRLENLAEQAKKRKQEHEKFSQYLTQRKRQQPRYKKYEQHFRQFEESLKEQQQEILQQRKLKAAPIDYQQLQKFKQSYEEQKIQALEHSQRKLKLQQQIIEQQNQWMKNLYKGNAYRNVEQDVKRNTIEEEHQTAHDKLKKTKEYAKMVKSQFIDQFQKDQQDQKKNIDYDSQDVRYRQKRILSKSLGLIPQKRVKPLTHQEKVKMGVSYLEHLRNLPRKGINSSNQRTNQTLQTPLKSERVGKTYKLKKATNPFYNIEKNNSSFDAKNHRQIELSLEQVRSRDFSVALQEKSLHYLQYSGVTEMQKRHLDVNRRLIGNINQKLDILKKLVD